MRSKREEKYQALTLFILGEGDCFPPPGSDQSSKMKQAITLKLGDFPK